MLLLYSLSMSVTIVLTLKGRDEFTYRWMHYMNEMRCQYKILVADGGESIEVQKNLSNYENYPNLNYEYIRYPFDENIIDFYSKLVNVLSKVTTEYVLQADNDDFYLLGQIPELINYLDNNQDYVSARGSLVNLEVFDKAGISKGKVNGYRYKAVTTYAPSIESELVLQRIKSLCLGMSTYDYYSNWYAITRTKVLVKIWSQLITLPIKEPIVLEMLTHILIVESGKVKINDNLFYIRQSNTSSFGDNLVLNNDFVERCLVNNSLSEFSFAVKNFMSLDKKDDEIIVLKNIASWLNIFIYNINQSHQIRSQKFFRLKYLLKKIRLIDFIFNYLATFFHIITKTRVFRNVKIREIELFILNSDIRNEKK
jgi:glycosyltransferase domain-containing protein